MSHDLLKNICYGYELDRIDESVHRLDESLASFRREGLLGEISLPELRRVSEDFFSRALEGVFGGQITMGDGLFIAALMQAVRPAQMMELGVASGYSSAFILRAADLFGLLAPGRPFLCSLDLDDGTRSGQPVGHVVSKYYPGYASSWRPTFGKTSIDLARSPSAFGLDPRLRTLAFVDAGHWHPWPAADLIALWSVLDRKSWVLMQDVRMMERWIADCVIYQVPCPPPQRGAELAVAHWPGRKVYGMDLAFNMSAVHLDVSLAELTSYWREMLRYHFEIEFSAAQVEELLSAEAR